MQVTQSIGRWRLQAIAMSCAAIFVTACSTTYLPAESATHVPTDRVRAFQEPGTNTGTVVVTRDSGVLGSGCFMGFWINGRLAARFDPGETATFHVPEGEILLRYGVDPEGAGLCGMHQSHGIQRESHVTAGGTKKYRLTMLAGGNPDIQRTH